MNQSYSREGHQISGSTWRISVLTPKVVRVEYSPHGAFEDRPSTFVFHREVACEDFTIRESSGSGSPLPLVIETEAFRLTYDGASLSPAGLVFEVLGGVTTWHSTWRYGQDISLPAHAQRVIDGKPPVDREGNFGGAARTLDEAYGRVPLEPGINSEGGFAVIDDSTSMLVGDDGHLIPRPLEEGYRDLILFASGRDAVGALRDFFAISGPQPIIPKFALGNWWSRYHRYTEESYLDLMDRFAERGIPLSVAVIDMDWHLTDIDPKWGSGWTGYTWDRDLFPDPERFQRELHERGMAVTLNVHPADGVRGHEDVYARMCEAMGREADGSPIAFDVNDPDFMSAYFDVLHAELESMGTDFWWVDWQQGPYSSVPGVDPLWVLNHEHFRDNEAKRGRGLTFSRYAGPGSHRYPVGFSGDTTIGWDALAFQPEFTAAAANIGYGWWSHDIGGHMGGYRDDELATRWLQFGVFSPIMRLHSSNSPFSGKEPWRYGIQYQAVMEDFLRLRHRMVPYLHSMNARASWEGRVICEPMYFEYPGMVEATGQYMFGSQLLAAPIVAPAVADVGRGSSTVQFPEGRWVDIFTGVSYRGARTTRVFRPLAEAPVFLRSGGFLPLIDSTVGSTDAPHELPPLHVLVGGGASGEFVLHEEVGEDTDDWVETRFALDADEGRVTVEGPTSSAGRRVRLDVLGCESALELPLTLDSDGRAGAENPVLVTRGHSGASKSGLLEALLNEAQVGFRLKEQVMGLVASRDGNVGAGEIAALGREADRFSGVVESFNSPSADFVAAVAEVIELD